ncbi:MAG: hypothetical protein K2L67_01825 [Clostridia bacterium]|nr:hypothetical protein [Clostridia bacterium]
MTEKGFFAALRMTKGDSSAALRMTRGGENFAQKSTSISMIDVQILAKFTKNNKLTYKK